MAEIETILDLFCGAGGAAEGYHRAFPDARIVGVDINPQPNYPFEFVQADAMTFDLSGFDFIHGSPPCQARTLMSNRYRGQGGPTDDHVDLIQATSDMVAVMGVPYVIENVDGARPIMPDAIRLTGGMFGLGVHRPRLFRCSFPVSIPKAHKVLDPVGVYGAKPDGRRLWTRADGTEQRACRSVEQGGEAMGIDWMTWRELAESIPPAYTEHIGRALQAALHG